MKEVVKIKCRPKKSKLGRKIENAVLTIRNLKRYAKKNEFVKIDKINFPMRFLDYIHSIELDNKWYILIEYLHGDKYTVGPYDSKPNADNAIQKMSKVIIDIDKKKESS